MKRFSELPYSRPDFEEASRKIVEYTTVFKNAAGLEEARELFLAHKAMMAEISTLRFVAAIRQACNTQDPFYEAEMASFNSNLPKLNLLVREADEVVLASEYRAALEEEIGSIYFRDLETQNRFADERIVEDMVEEGQLMQQYSKISATATIDFQGENCNFYGLLKHMQSTNRTERKAAFEAWAKLYSQIAPQLDEVYDSMVRVRDNMAKKLGFTSYTEMAYLKYRRYDYSQEDVANFRRQVRETITPACQKIFQEREKTLGLDKLCYYDESLAYPEGNPMPKGDKTLLIKNAQQMYREMSPETGVYFDTMVEFDMFDLETRPGKLPGGFCAPLYTHRIPFIFSNFNGTSADINVLTHEAGHGFEVYSSTRALPLPEMTFSTNEVNEIHSMSMELFAYPWMELFFGEDAEKYRQSHLADALITITYIVSVDEFQERVFEKPDMTAAERYAVWQEIEQVYMPWRNYDGNAFMEQGGFWLQKQHIFLYPFYYIEYALAQVCAFEFYSRMKEDRTSAWSDYCKLCCAGGSLGYFQLLQLANLTNPFQEGSVKRAVTTVLKELGL